MSTRYFPPIPLLLLCLLSLFPILVACSWYDRGTFTETRYGSFNMRLKTDRQGVPVGKSVHATFTVRNRSSRPIVLDSAAKPVMELEVSDGLSHKRLVAWSTLNPGLAKNHLEWNPGEVKTIELSWTGEAAQSSRNVFIEGLLNGNDRLLEAVSLLLNVFWDRN